MSASPLPTAEVSCASVTAHSTTIVSENCVADLPVIIPLAGAESNESSSGSGTSSPQHGEACDDHYGSERTSATKTHDADFNVDDLDMWDMILAIDGAPPSAPACLSSP